MYVEFFKISIKLYCLLLFTEIQRSALCSVFQDYNVAYSFTISVTYSSRRNISSKKLL